MSELEKAFENIKKLNKKPTNEELLLLYSFYKQATVGDIKKEKPSVFHPKERAKWNAHNSLKGIEKSEASSRYISLVYNLLKKYS